MTTMTLPDTLLAYSEWLDSEGLIRPDSDDPDHDDRPHDDLVRSFLDHWAADPNRARLAGVDEDRDAVTLVDHIGRPVGKVMTGPTAGEGRFA